MKLSQIETSQILFHMVRLSLNQLYTARRFHDSTIPSPISLLITIIHTIMHHHHHLAKIAPRNRSPELIPITKIRLDFIQASMMSRQILFSFAVVIATAAALSSGKS